MRGFDVSVLVGLANVDPLGRDAIMFQQVTIPGSELSVIGKIIDRGAEAITTMLAGYAAQLPEGVLEAAAEGFEGLGEANRHRFPIGVREREVIEQVVERSTRDGDSQLVHVGEVGRGDIPRTMNLGEHDFLLGTVDGPPRAYSPLEGTPLRLLEPARVDLLDPSEQGKGSELRLGLQPSPYLVPHVVKGVRPRSPRAGQRHPLGG